MTLPQFGKTGLAQAPAMISSLLQNPANGTTPAWPATPIMKVQKVIGMQLAQPAHLLHVLLPVHAVDHAAAAEEEQGLEEGVGDQVEDRRTTQAPAPSAERM